MSVGFDPYLEWLGITPAERPADYYALLGLKQFEGDREQIFQAADQRMELIRKYQTGKRAKQSQKLLNEISSARVCLLDERKRQSYDNMLRRLGDTYGSVRLPPLKQVPDILPESDMPEHEVFPNANSSELLEPKRRPGVFSWLIPGDSSVIEVIAAWTIVATVALLLVLSVWLVVG